MVGGGWVGKPNLVKCFGPRLRLWTWTLDFVLGPSFSIFRQEALSSAGSEKDAHLAWQEVTGEGNVHTKGTIERLRRERRELLQRMKDEVVAI